MIDKAWKVVFSCNTVEHARTAMRYLDLMAERHPELDIGTIKRELVTLFDLN